MLYITQGKPSCLFLAYLPQPVSFSVRKEIILVSTVLGGPHSVYSSFVLWPHLFSGRAEYASRNSFTLLEPKIKNSPIIFVSHNNFA